MNLASRLLLTVLLAGVVLGTISGVALADERIATITLGRDPEPPFCILNPGGTVEYFWDIDHYTTPNYVRYLLQDPTRLINIEEVIYPGDTGIHGEGSWTVPSGLPDGRYWIRVEYYSYEAGNEANAEVTFFVCVDRGTLCEEKREDANCNGVLDDDDPPVPGWLLCFRGPDDAVYCHATDENGMVCWDGIPAGDYEAFEMEVAGWDPVGPTSYDVHVGGGQNPTVQFLNVREGSCEGACCLENQECIFTTPDRCEEAGGTYLGPGVSCEPNPCEETATEKTTWGHIRATFR
ncbi:MAG: hypothetical protein ACE15D_17600 [Candidatus Eisenbacteria bacterium]|nr:hypothetical protein [Candidatus Eisenbacteria bacterium]